MLANKAAAACGVLSSLSTGLHGPQINIGRRKATFLTNQGTYDKSDGGNQTKKLYSQTHGYINKSIMCPCQF